MFEKLTDREKATAILAENGVKFRTGKTLVPFRLTGDIDWGVSCPEIDGIKGQTFYVWPESLWAPISFTKTYLMSKGYNSEEWRKFWASEESQVYQFIGEDNLYFYGPAQQALFGAMNQNLIKTNIIPSKHVLFLNKKASSSGSFKPPMANDMLNYYTAEQLRMHFLGMNLGNNNVSFMPKAFNPDAKADEVDVVLKEGNLLTNVYNRVLRTLFYTTQAHFDGIVPVGSINPEITAELKNHILNYERFMAERKFHQVINVVDVLVRNINKYWVKNAASFETDKELEKQTIINTLHMVRVAVLMLHPVAPKSTENLVDFLKLDRAIFSWANEDKLVYDFMANHKDHRPNFLEPKQDFFKKHPSQLEEN